MSDTQVTEEEENIEILKSLNQLNRENKLEGIRTEIEEQYQPPAGRLEEPTYTEEVVRSCIKEKLGLTININDKYVRSKELGDIIYYYLTKSEQPHEDERKVIYSIWDPLDRWYRGWYKWLCEILGRDDEIFGRLMRKLHDNQTMLVTLILKQPQILFTGWRSHRLIGERFMEHLPREKLHQILMKTRDDEGKTVMFYSGLSMYYIKQYRHHEHDLYDLLSINDKKNQTALLANPEMQELTELLIYTYSPKHRDKLINLLKLTDIKNKANDPNQARISWLYRQITNNNYVLYEPNVLIIYNTRDSETAEEEAQVINQALTDLPGWYWISMEGNKNREEIINLIEQSAQSDWQERTPTGLIVILILHGCTVTIEDCYGKPLNLNDVETAMCSNEEMKDRPKLLIVQASRNDIQHTASSQPTITNETVCDGRLSGESSLNIHEINHDHFCFIQTCIPRRLNMGKTMIEILAQKLNQVEEKEPVEELLSSIIRNMKKYCPNQTSTIQSTLKYAFCLMDTDRSRLG